MNAGGLARRWLVRFLVVVLACTTGYAACAYTVAQVVARRNIDLARRLAPYDGRIAARYAASLSGPNASAADRRRADAFAQTALESDPTAVMAVSTLGINAQFRGETKRASRLFAYSQLLSRRDLQTQLWAIEYAVGQGNVADALRHYDIALRTTPAVRDTLFPILSTAIANPGVRSALEKRLLARPNWADSFIHHVAVHGEKPKATVLLFTAIRDAGHSIPEAANASLINQLIAKQAMDDAWAYYVLVRPGVSRRASRDSDFRAILVAPSPFDWTPANDVAISASIQPADDGGLFDFAAAASVGGVLLRQVQWLPPGSYQLEGKSVGIEQADRALPYWTLRCRDGRELGRVDVPRSATAGGRFEGQFEVPISCPVQTLAMIARPSDDVSGVTGQIEYLRLATTQRPGRRP